MNKTKRTLIIVVIVLNLLSIALNAYLMAMSIIALVKTPYEALLWFNVIYTGLGIIAYIASVGLLWYSIAHDGNFFRQRSNYYMTAVILTLILDTFSIPSILLLITLFMTDMVWVKPIDDVYFKKTETKDVPKQEKTMSDKDRERKIAELRELKNQGLITDEEFNEQLFKLL